MKRVLASCCVPEGDKVWRKVIKDAEPVEIQGFEGYQFVVGRAFVAKKGKPIVDTHLWAVTECTTGFYVGGKDTTKQAAVRNATNILTLVGTKSLDRAMEKAKALLAARTVVRRKP